MPSQKNQKKSEAFEKQNLIILILLLIFFIITVSFYIIFNVSLKDSQSDKDNPTITVARIIDGDTFEISSRETVRLICIDAPEKGRQGYNEAKQFLSDLILDKQIRLEKDVSETDEYERLLRYVYVNDSNNNEIFVNKELVKQGYAILFPYGNDTKKCSEIENN